MNYKITTIILAVVLVIVCGLFWYCVAAKQSVAPENVTSTQTYGGGMHMMPDGTVMSNNGFSMMDMTMNDMVKDLQGKTGKELEKAFLAGMIPHHQGAVDMAKLLLQDKSIDPKFVKFGNDIITAQEGEINMMKGWLKSY